MLLVLIIVRHLDGFLRWTQAVQHVERVPCVVTVSEISAKSVSFLGTEALSSTALTATGCVETAVGGSGFQGEEDKGITKKPKTSKPRQALSASWNTSKYRGVTRHRRSGRYAELSE